MNNKDCVTDILYADYDIEDSSVMFVVFPESNQRYEFKNYNESHEPVVIIDKNVNKKYLVKFDI